MLNGGCLQEINLFLKIQKIFRQNLNFLAGGRDRSLAINEKSIQKSSGICYRS
jgi:hypothetical protein